MSKNKHYNEFLAEVLQDVEQEEQDILDMELDPNHWYCQ